MWIGVGSFPNKQTNKKRKVKIGDVSKLVWEGTTHEIGGKPSECVSLKSKKESQGKEWLAT